MNHPPSNRDIVAQAFAGWASGGTNFYDLLAPEVVWTIPGISAHAGTYRGKEAFLTPVVKPFMARFSTPMIPSVRKIWADGDDVAILWDSQATDGDGKPYANTYGWFSPLPSRGPTRS